MILRNKHLMGFYLILFIIMLSATVSASRLPTVDGDDDAWGTILNDFLNVSHNESGELRNDTVSTLQIVNGTITDVDISDTTNLTLGEKITFTLGEIIDNIVDGWITITGGLNVTQNLNVVGNATISGNLTVSQNVTADWFKGNLNWSDVQNAPAYIENNTAGWNLTFSNIYSTDWTNISITESQISNLQSYIANGSNINVLDVNASSATIHGDLNVTGTSYLGDITITADNITTNGVVSKDGNISFYNNTGSEMMRITNDGKVGIGTVTPSHELNVVGDVNVTGNVTVEGNLSVIGNASADWFKGYLNWSDVQNAPAYIENNTAGWNLTFSNISSNDWTNVTITESQISDLQSYVANGSNINVLDVNASSAAIHGNLNITEAVGVTPTIASNYDNIIIQNNDDASDDVGMTFIAGSSAECGIDFGDNDSSNDGGITYSHQTLSMTLQTNDATRITINGVGDTGIGTVPVSAARLAIRAKNTDDILNLFETDGDEVFTVLESGNVGIGETNPQQSLVVAGDLNVTGTSYLGDITITADNITTNGVVSKDGNISFYNNTGSEIMRITNEGKVGIGIIDPSSELEIAGSALTQTDSALRINDSFSDGNYIDFGKYRKIGVFNGGNFFMGYNFDYNTTENSYQYELEDQAAGVEFTTDGDIKFRTASSGSVGNAFTPTDQLVIKNNGLVNVAGDLNVTGDINATGVVYSTKDVQEVYDTSIGASGDTVTTTNTLATIQSTYSAIYIFTNSSIHGTSMYIDTDDLQAGNTYEMAKYDTRYVVIQAPTTTSSSTWTITYNDVAVSYIRIKGIY